MLKITDLTASIEDNTILNRLTLEVPAGQMHAIIGRNGSGKSTLVHTIAGTPHCQVTSGSMLFKGENITELKLYERSRLGIFCAFQNPPVIPGLSVWHFLKESYAVLCESEKMSADDLRAQVYELLDYLDLSHSFLERGLYEGFSGGEKKRFELLQMMLFKPAFIIFDEIDSGLDIEGRALVIQVLTDYLKNHPHASMLIISHYPDMLGQLPLDALYSMHEGALVQTEVSSLHKAGSYGQHVTP